jgi:transposase
VCWSKIFINWLKEQKLTTCAGTQCLQVLIADLEYNRTQLLMILKNIRKLMTQSFSKLWNLLLSIPCIGPVNAITLISEIEDVKRFPSEPHFASFFGLLPSEASSDQKVIVKEINPRCNKYLRTMLVEAAWVAIRCSPSLLAY